MNACREVGGNRGCDHVTTKWIMVVYNDSGCCDGCGCDDGRDDLDDGVEE